MNQNTTDQKQTEYPKSSLQKAVTQEAELSVNAAADPKALLPV